MSCLFTTTITKATAVTAVVSNVINPPLS